LLQYHEYGIYNVHMAMGLNPVRGVLNGGGPAVGGGGFNAFAAGNKVYNGGTAAPNTGGVSPAGQRGYTAREQRNQLYRNTIANRAMGGQ